MWKLLGQGKIPFEKNFVNTAVLVACISKPPLEMQQPDSTGDSASARRMAPPVSVQRRGASNAAGGAPSSLASQGSTSLSSSLMPADDYKPSTLILPPAPAASSLGSQHPPQSLSIHSQSTLLAPILTPAGAQIKKKSGFQITSVTPAQISVSTNNSITEDTESCDDLDESHTEDLSSSEILDVSLSRANDTGAAERSSSEETLSNFHEAETPGAVSPNQPHVLPQPHGTMVNGAVQHQHRTHHTLHHHQFHATPSGNTHAASSGSTGTQAGILLGSVVTSTTTPSTGTLPAKGQKMSLNVGGILENVSVGTPNVIGQTSVTVALGTSAGMVSAAPGAAVSVIKPLTSNVSNVNILNSNVPGLGGISANGSSVVFSSGLNNTHNQNINLIQQQSGVVSSVVSMTTSTTTSAVIGSTSGSHVGLVDMAQPTSVASVSSAQPQQAQVPPPTTGSRFRVVKLDSSSEPFRKGRWTCTEYYDKEAPGPGVPENVPSTRSVESIRQFVPDTISCSESASGGSVSTLSHYSESVGSLDIGGSTAVQQIFPQPPTQMADYSTPASIAKPHMQRQDIVHQHLKASATPLPASTQQQVPVSMVGLQTTTGHPSPPQQLTYAQAAQLTSAQGLPGVSQQQMAYPHAQQPAAAAQVASVHVNPLSQGGSLPPEFTQSQQIIQATPPGSAQTLPCSVPPVAVAGNTQMMQAPQPPAVAHSLPHSLLQPQQTPSPQMVQAPASGVMPQLVQSAGSGVIKKPQGQPLSSQLSIEQQAPLNSQGLTTQFVPAVTTSLTTSNVPPSHQSDPQSSLVHDGGKDAGSHPPVSALYATLPSLMATQLEDAQRLLFQHQSLLAFPKLAAGECASQAGTSSGPEESGGVSALTASASLLKNLPVDGEEDSSSGASVVAIDNKIEQAMDLVKSHLMYAVREEVEVLKEQIKELIERNSQLEQENNLLKNLASPEQLAQFQAQVQSGSSPLSAQGVQPSAVPAQLSAQNSGPSA
ncbi:TSC22 domain family protein 1 isoform X1 [Electrophorus electricus]|uniref:TSC22 domain family protein 1 isoform X1 n=1 Tax=Electrophorus electricus TaxID=8005 RepID=UPI0015CFBA13|nr:TSC22 domain family protein 1 isoform X1 [Electrophorus electricus]